MAFAKPDIRGKEIADRHRLLHEAGKKPRSRRAGHLADLVNNEKADILATAYAPAEPDYARASPFESLLKDRADTTAASFRRWPRAITPG